jgi:hypothetical protein
MAPILVTDACSGDGRCDIGTFGSLTMGQLRSAMVKEKVAPLPGSEVTQMRPPWRSTIFLQIANPIPLPAYRYCAGAETPEKCAQVLRVDVIPLSPTASTSPRLALDPYVDAGRLSPRNFRALPMRF